MGSIYQELGLKLMGGVIFAVLTSIAFALYITPRKLSRLPASTFNLLMAAGFLSGSILPYLMQTLSINNERPTQNKRDN